MSKLLIDFDSKIPNLALMKTSSYFKGKQQTVYLNKPEGDFDEVWLSCIFTWNRDKAMSAINLYESMGKKVYHGGTGFDWGWTDNRIQLPPEIEAQQPDYSLYNDDRAIGFAQRGCDRKCEFCDVWKKEGKIQRGYIPIRLIVPEDRNKLLLLDNDIALSTEHDNIFKECRELGIKVSITQGYDIRCMTKERAQFLAQDKPWDLDFKRRRIYIAWDYLGIENFVKDGIDMLLDAGFRATEIFCYIICGFNTTHDQDLYRFYKLQEYGAEPYVMPFNNRKDDKWLNHFTRYVNRGYCRWIDATDYKNGVMFA
jgi:hypothetical protein